MHDWCSDNTMPSQGFTVRATTFRAHAIYDIPQYNAKIAAGGQNKYKFCVINGSDTRADLFSYTDSSQCPDTYTKLDMTVSRTNENATIEDLVWRTRSSDMQKTWIDLLSSDPDTRSGTYYLNVGGHCTPDSDPACTKPGGLGTCAPCSNLGRSEYSLLVHPKTEFPVSSQYLGSCMAATGSSKQTWYPTAAPTAVVVELVTFDAAQVSEKEKRKEGEQERRSCFSHTTVCLLNLLFTFCLLFFSSGLQRLQSGAMERGQERTDGFRKHCDLLHRRNSRHHERGSIPGRRGGGGGEPRRSLCRNGCIYGFG